MTAEEQAQTRQWAHSRATLVKELKEKLLKLGLKTSGKKEDLAKRLATDGRLDKQEAATKEKAARLITGEHLDKLKSYLNGIGGKAAKLMHPYSTNVLESMNSLKAGLAGKHWRRIGTHSARADLALLRFNLVYNAAESEHFLVKLLEECSVPPTDIPDSCHAYCKKSMHESKRNRKVRQDSRGKRSKTDRTVKRKTMELKCVAQVIAGGGQHMEELEFIKGSTYGGKRIMDAAARDEEFDDVEIIEENRVSTTTEETWMENIRVTEAQAAAIASYPQGSDLWKKSREGRITASNFHRAVGRNNATFVRDQVWAKTFKGNEHTEHGQKSEPKARAAYKSRVVQYLNLTDVSRIEIEQRGLIVPLEDSWLGASPDGIVTLTTVSGEETKILLEIKCPPIATYNSVDELKKKKPEYIAQVNGTMGCFYLKR